MQTMSNNIVGFAVSTRFTHPIGVDDVFDVFQARRRQLRKGLAPLYISFGYIMSLWAGDAHHFTNLWGSNHRQVVAPHSTKAMATVRILRYSASVFMPAQK